MKVMPALSAATLSVLLTLAPVTQFILHSL